MGNWMHRLRPVPIPQVHGDSRYLVSIEQITEAAVALQYYTLFSKSCSSSTVNWALHQLFKEHIFRAMNMFDPRGNAFLPTLAASWTYFEFAMNPKVVHADLIKVCEEAIEVFKRDDVTSVYERLRGRHLAPPLFFIRNMFFMLDDRMKSVGGYFILFEFVRDRLKPLLPGQFRCIDMEEFHPS